MRNKKKYCPLLFNHKSAGGKFNAIQPNTDSKCKENDCTWWSIDKSGIGKCSISGINELARLLSVINSNLTKQNLED